MTRVEGRNPDRLPHFGINLVNQWCYPEQIVTRKQCTHVVQNTITGIAIQHTRRHISNGIK